MKRLFILLTVIAPVLCSSYEYKPRVWQRIPQGVDKVETAILEFLIRENITNCYQFMERDNLMRLRCLKNGNLTDVRLEVDEEEEDYDWIEWEDRITLSI